MDVVMIAGSPLGRIRPRGRILWIHRPGLLGEHKRETP